MQVVMKNHNTKHLKEAKAVFLLVRNPYDAILAEFNRKQGKGGKGDTKHTASAGHEVFNTTKWTDVAQGLSTRWVELHLKYVSWAKTYAKPMHIIFYENLKSNSTNEMGKFLHFYRKHFGFYPEDAERRLRCLSKDRILIYLHVSQLYSCEMRFTTRFNMIFYEIAMTNQNSP